MSTILMPGTIILMSCPDTVPEGVTPNAAIESLVTSKGQQELAAVAKFLLGRQHIPTVLFCSTSTPEEVAAVGVLGSLLEVSEKNIVQQNPVSESTAIEQTFNHLDGNETVLIVGDPRFLDKAHQELSSQGMQGFFTWAAATHVLQVDSRPSNFTAARGKYELVGQFTPCVL